MKRFFDMESPFMRVLTVAADLIIVNILTLVCSLPVVTLGASLTAMSDALGRLVRGEEGYMTKDFFRAFGANFKKGTLLGLLLLVCAGLLYIDFRAAGAVMPVMRPGIAAIGVILLAVTFYAFALLARYENTLRGTLKNAATLAVAYFPRTLGMVVCAAALWILSLRFYQIGIPILVLFGLALPCYVNLLLLKDVFRKLEGTEETDGSED